MKCSPKCGYLTKALPLIVNGLKASDPLPWYAALYILKAGVWEYSCSGSLITESIILTVSHCFNGVSEANVRFALGRIYSNYSIQPDEENAKMYDVTKITRHPLYMDKIGNYGSDIALVELNETVTLNDFIHPVCIDWDLDDITSHLKQDQLGLVMGMGVTENDTFSDTIRVIKLPVLSNEECIRRQPQDFQKYVTFTTFCGGFGNGSGVCNGDSGSGYNFPIKDDRWALQGLVSLSPRKESSFFCDPNKYTVFTKVGLYVKWIKHVLEDVHATHKDEIKKVYEPIL